MTGNSTLRVFNKQVVAAQGETCALAWEKINSSLQFYGASGSIDFTRMRYDAVWVMKESLRSGDPLSLNSLMYALDCLETYYEDQAKEKFLQLSAHNESLEDAQYRVQFRAEKTCEAHNLQKKFVPFSRLCHDIHILEKQEEARPYLKDLCVIRTLKEIVSQDKADYMHTRNMIDDFVEWRSTDDFAQIVSAYEVLIFPSTLSFKSCPSVSLGCKP